MIFKILNGKKYQKEASESFRSLRFNLRLEIKKIVNNHNLFFAKLLEREIKCIQIKSTIKNKLSSCFRN
jgi:hypothetical protein